jgi:hypothetical protein
MLMWLSAGMVPTASGLESSSGIKQERGGEVATNALSFRRYHLRGDHTADGGDPPTWR